MVQQKQKLAGELRVLLNHIYEYKKGVRGMVLCTLNERFREFATRRLESQNIAYCIQELCPERFNLYFGKEECLRVIKFLIHKPLSEMTPEEDFIIGTLLGYDVCIECSRYCTQKQKYEQKRNLKLA